MVHSGSSLFHALEITDPFKIVSSSIYVVEKWVQEKL